MPSDSFGPNSKEQNLFLTRLYIHRGEKMVLRKSATGWDAGDRQRFVVFLSLPLISGFLQAELFSAQHPQHAPP